MANDIHVEDGVEYYKFEYKGDSNSSFGKILREYVKPYMKVRRSTPFVDLTLKKNPHVKDWMQVSKNKVFIIYLNKEFILPIKLKSHLQILRKKYANELAQDRLAKLEQERLTKLQQERLTKLEQERLAKVEQERLAKVEQERLAKVEQERLAKVEQERLAKVEQERLAKVEQERLAKVEQDRLAKVEQERLAKVEQDRLAKVEQDRLAKVEQERLAKVEQGRLAKVEQERLAKVEQERLAKVEQERLAKLEKEKNAIITVEQPDPGKFRFSGFYMLSSTMLTETDISSGSAISYNMDTFLTFGLASSYRIPKKKWSISSSFYFSKYADATVSSGGTTAVPSEIGITLYAQYQLDWFKQLFGVHSGLDYENFGSFDLAEVQTNFRLIARKNNLKYITFGGYKVFSISKRNYFTKVSFSKLVSGSNDIGQSFSGVKGIAYLRTNISKNIFVHTLLKKHSLSTEVSDISILKIGVGAGYDF
jgi:hypothetical protein